MFEKYQISAKPNRAVAGLGGLLLAGGLVTLAWGCQSESAAGDAQYSSSSACYGSQEMSACNQTSDHTDEAAAVQQQRNGVLLGVVGVTTIFYAYKRDRKAAEPTSLELPFEQELALFMDNKIMPAADVPKEI